MKNKMKVKNVVKIALIVIAVWLISATLHSTLSSHIDPAVYLPEAEIDDSDLATTLSDENYYYDDGHYNDVSNEGLEIREETELSGEEEAEAQPNDEEEAETQPNDEEEAETQPNDEAGTVRENGIRGIVWLDEFGNGEWNETVPVLAGVSVRLYDANDVTRLIDEVETNAQGEFLFENLSGFYILQIESYEIGQERIEVPVVGENGEWIGFFEYEGIAEFSVGIESANAMVNDLEGLRTRVASRAGNSTPYTIYLNFPDQSVTSTVEGVSENQGTAITIPAGANIIIRTSPTVTGRNTWNQHVQNQRHFIVEEGAILTLEDVILSRTITGNDISSGGVHVNGGTLIMNRDSEISDNHWQSNGSGWGSGVLVGSVDPVTGGSLGLGGSLVMNEGALITRNRNTTAPQGNTPNGGGVAIVGVNASFELNGGTISYNTATHTGSAPELLGGTGGGVAVHYGANFWMRGGLITGNTANYGGGVYVAIDSTLNAAAGWIVNNTAYAGDGGGIFTEDHRYEYELNAGDYGNIRIGNGIVFEHNTASRRTGTTPSRPHVNIELTNVVYNIPTSYPWGDDHPLNNYDINYYYALDEEDPAVSIIKTSPATGLTGDALTYTLRVRNTGNVSLTGLVIRDTLPAELENLRHIELPAGSIGGFTGNTLEVTLGTLAPGESVVITFVVDIAADVVAGTVIENTATIENADVYDEDATITVVEEDPSVSITKTSPATGLPGEALTYTLRVRNTGNVPVTGLVVTDTLPSELENLRDVELPVGAIGNFTENTLEVILDTLAPRESVVITFVVDIAADVVAGTVIENTATIENADVYDEDATATIVDGDSSVSITKTSSQTGLPGEALTYTLRVRNTGNVPVAGLVVTDTLPSELENPRDVELPAGATGGFTENTLEVILDTLAPRESVVITFVVDIHGNAVAGTVIRNTATVEYPNNADVYDADAMSIVVEADPSVSITKTGQATALPGESITYTLRATNTGNVSLTGLVVTDTLPSGLENLRDVELPAGATGGFTENTLEVILDTLAPGESVVITFVVDIREDVEAGTVIRNTATVDYPDNAGVYGADTTATVIEEDPSVSITKTSPSTGLPGEALTYTLRVRNTGNVSLTGLVVTDTLPSGLENLRDVELPDGATGGFTENTLEVVLDTLAPGESVIITFVVDIREDVEADTVIRNTAMVEYPDNADVSDNDTATTVVEEDLSVSITKTSPSTGLPGEALTYTLRVRNTGNVSLTGLMVTDTLPRGLENLRDVELPDGATGGFTRNTLEVILDTLAPGESAIITFVVDIREDIEAGTVIRNTATVEHPDNADVSDDDTTTTVVEENPSVSITKTGQAEASPGESITYTLRATNTGNVSLTGLVVTDTLPRELRSPRDVELPDGATGGFTRNTLEVTLDTLPPGESVVITFVVDIREDVPADIVIENTARVGYPDNDNVYDEDIAATVIAGEDTVPSVSITKTGQAEASPGESITYTLRATNTGDVSLTGLVVTDTLPSELRSPRDVELPDGATGGFTRNTLEVTLDTLTPGESVIITFVVDIREDVPADIVIENTARVGYPDNDNVYDEDTAATVIAGEDTVPSPSVSLTKTGQAEALPGDALTYTLRVTNTGDVSLTGLVITDSLPSQLENLRDIELPAGATDDFTDNTLEVILDTLAPEESVVVTFVMDVAAEVVAGTVIESITTIEYPGNADVYDVDAMLTIVGEEDQAPSVSLTKTGQAEALPGEALTYTLRVTNTGDVSLTGLVLTDSLPSQLENLRDIELPDGATDDFTDNTLEVILDTLAPEESVVVTFVMDVAAEVVAGTVIESITTIEYPGNADVYDADAMLTVVGEDDQEPSVSIEATFPLTGIAGESITYVLRVTNTGNVPLTGLVVTDTLPSELENPRSVVLPTGATGGFVENVLTVTLGTLVPSESVIITFVADIAADVIPGTEIEHTVTVLYPDNDDVYDDDATVTVVNDEDAASEDADEGPSVSIEKMAPSTGIAGDAIAYTLTVRNTGDVSLMGLVITAALPDELENPRNLMRPDGATVGFTEDILEIILGRLAPGESAVITFVVDIVDEVEVGTVINKTATVEYLGDDDVYDAADTMVRIVAEGDSIQSVSIEKAAPLTALTEDTIAYTLTMSNTGNVSLTGLIVRDILPGELENARNVMLPAGAAGGFTENVLGVILDTLAPGESVAITFVVDIVAEVEVGAEVENIATIEYLGSNNVYDDDDATVTIIAPPELDESVRPAPTLLQTGVIAGLSVLGGTALSALGGTALSASGTTIASKVKKD